MKCYDVTQTRTVNFRAIVEIGDEVPEDKLEEVLRAAVFDEISEAFGDGTNVVTIDYLALEEQEWEEV